MSLTRTSYHETSDLDDTISAWFHMMPIAVKQCTLGARITIGDNLWAVPRCDRRYGLSSFGFRGGAALLPFYYVERVLDSGWQLFSLVDDAPRAERLSLCMFSYVSCRGNEPLSAKRAVSIPPNVTSRPIGTVLFHPAAGMGV